jgi:hypothetical protein
MPDRMVPASKTQRLYSFQIADTVFPPESCYHYAKLLAGVVHGKVFYTRGV